MADTTSGVGETGWELQNAAPWIDPEKRQRLLQIHQRLGSEWTDQMREYLRRGDEFTFCGLLFENLKEIPELSLDYGSSIGFSFETSPIIGTIGVSRELAEYLLKTQLGGEQSVRGEAKQEETLQTDKSDGQPPSPQQFTRVEKALLRKYLTSLGAKLGSVYDAAGLGKPKIVDQKSGDSSLALLADYQLMVFRYRLGAADSNLNLVIATLAGIADVVPSLPRESRNGEDDVSLALSAAPLDVKLVLGNWNATIQEVSGLRRGDEIVLQDGEDAWLVADSVPIKPVRVRLENGRIIVELTKTRNDGA
ncbi:MAG TPA: hypothetical protein VJ728_14345 [Candidatus Binataceae bacterium]|nr:hypothetical protein [Candidatus Binataceae bacterium]